MHGQLTLNPLKLSLKFHLNFFCAKLDVAWNCSVTKGSNFVIKYVQIKHNTTTAYRPQANITPEVFNKTIAKYLSSFVLTLTQKLDICI